MRFNVYFSRSPSARFQRPRLPLAPRTYVDVFSQYVAPETSVQYDVSAI